MKTQQQYNVVNHLKDHHFSAKQRKLVSECARLTQRLKTHVATLHLHTNEQRQSLSDTAKSASASSSD